jgi:hypothetical protein
MMPVRSGTIAGFAKQPRPARWTEAAAVDTPALTFDVVIFHVPGDGDRAARYEELNDECTSRQPLAIAAVTIQRSNWFG